MKIYNKENVLIKAKERINYLFDEFENVVVGFSGGKDSTVVLNLALEIAEQKNRLPLNVLFVDQEAEWQHTIDYVKTVMYDKRVKPMWYQMPMVITNNASSYNRYSYCWNEEEKDKWIHAKDEISIKENIYGTDRFHELFEKIFKVEFKEKKACYLAGVRTEESPKRYVSLTEDATYKWITWGKKLYKTYNHYTFYPIYDWSFTDVWKYIHDNNIKYNKIYDEYYRHGVKLSDMRVSNLHHETAIQSLLLVQEIEPKTWNKVVERIDGASCIKHIKKNSFECPKELPYMFNDWEDYAIYLANNLIQDEKNKIALLNKYEKRKIIYSGQNIKTKFIRKIIDTILSSDWDFTKIINFEMSPYVGAYRQYKQNIIKKELLLNTRMFTEDEIIDLKNKINAKFNTTY